MGVFSGNCMKKKIAIIGSTGSIGKNLLDIVNRDKKNFEILLLTANKNYRELFKQAKKFNVKNLIITDQKSFQILKKKNKNAKINIFNDFSKLSLIFKKKIDYLMSSITGIDGLKPTLKSIKFTKTIAIANKESIVCGWNLINKELKKNKTSFIPVDSEHFSLWYGLRSFNSETIEKIYLTASGGPLFNLSLNKFKNVSINQALKHPNWSMGKKISIDSATMMNKIYEVIEAKNIFNLSYNKIKILIHPQSYVHALIKFKSGLIKIIAHDTTMKIPIFNTIYLNNNKYFETTDVNINSLNNLNFSNINTNRYPMTRLLNILPTKSSLFETVIVSANDTYVELFLNKKIKFIEIQKNLFKLIKNKKFIKFKNRQPKNADEIIKLNNYVRFKILKNVYKSKNV